MNELEEMRQAVATYQEAVAAAQSAFDAAILRAYRARRANGEAAFTLAEIGAVFGVTRQRAYQIVRESARRQGEASPSLD